MKKCGRPGNCFGRMFSELVPRLLPPNIIMLSAVPGPTRDRRLPAALTRD